MIDMKHLTEWQKVVVYKKLCESALRVYSGGNGINSVDEWKQIYDTILSITGVKERKVSKGLRLFSDIEHEDISENTSNRILRDGIARCINELDDGSDHGNLIIHKIHTFTRAIRGSEKSLRQ